MLQPVDIDRIGLTMTDGIHRVQVALAPRYGIYPSRPRTAGLQEEFSIGLLELDRVQEALGATGLVPAVDLEGMSQSFPREPVIEGVLRAVGISPRIDTAAKIALSDKWINAVSSGHGRLYPFPVVARHMAASIIQEMAEHCYSHHMMELSGYIDDELLVVKALKKLNALAAKHAAK